MGFISSFKAGYDGRDSGRFSVEGIEVKCSQCGSELFDGTSALLNSRGMTFLDLDWANSGAHLLVCRKCSHIEWFAKEPYAL